MNFNLDSDKRQMLELEEHLKTVLLRAKRQGMEPGVAAMALVRCARVLLDQYPVPARQKLIDAIDAFLNHRDVEDSHLILM